MHITTHNLTLTTIIIIIIIIIMLDLLEYTDTFVEWDPLLLGCGPSNPWMSDDTTYWEINKPM